MSVRPSLLGALAFSLVAALVSCTARAAITPAGPAVEVLGNGWRVLEPTNLSATPASNRTWTAGAPGVTVSDGINIAGKAGSLPVTVTRVAPWAVVGGAIARCLAAVNPLCAAGSAAYMLWDAYRVKPDAAGGLSSDPGQSPTSGSATPWYTTAGHLSPSNPLYVAQGTAQQVCDAIVRDSWGDNRTGSLSPNGQTGYGPQYLCTGAYFGAFNVPPAGTTAGPSQCPAYTFGGQQIPAGSAGIGPDGKCPTGTYSQPLNFTDAGNRLAAYPPAGNPNTVQAVKDAVSSGQQLANNPMSITGPASQTGTPTTTNDGTSTTTTTPTYVYNYSGDTITVNTTNNTTVVNNSTGQTTSTTTTTNPAPAQTETRTDCDKYPDSLACMKVGEAPTDAIPKVTRNVDFQAEAVTLPEGCPADVPLPGGQVLSYAPTCAAFTMARPIVIAAAAVAAMLMVVFALRGQ